MLYRCAALLLVIALAGCATKKATTAPQPAQVQQVAAAKPKGRFSLVALLTSPLRLIPKKKSPPQAEPPLRVGTVKLVDTESKFVLIDATNLGGVLPGDPLVCIANQQETARLRLSVLRSPPFLIADIISGKPSVGERVFKQ